MTSLQIHPWATPTPASDDERIARAIDRWLARVARPQRRFLAILVLRGEVTLTGVVASRRARARIYATVRQVPGVVAVQDRLRVRGMRRYRTVIPPVRWADDTARCLLQL